MPLRNGRNGGVIGQRNLPSVNSARGVWQLSEIDAARREAAWPRTLEPGTMLAVTFDAGADYTDYAQGLVASNTASVAGLAAFTSQSLNGARSLYVRNATTANAATTNRITYGSGSQWDITAADFTIECWVYSLENTYYHGLVCRDNQADRRNWQFIKTSSVEGSVLYFRIFNTNATTFLDVSDSSVLTANQWNHVAVVRDNGVLRLYRGGVQRASANFSGATGTRSVASGPITIGAINDNGNYCLNGYIDEVLVSATCRYPNGTTFIPQTSLGIS
jgi:hypothetical protein